HRRTRGSRRGARRRKIGVAHRRRSRLREVRPRRNEAALAHSAHFRPAPAGWVNLPHVTQFDEADITDLEDVRTNPKQKAAQEGINLTPLAFIVRAIVKALQE